MEREEEERSEVSDVSLATEEGSSVILTSPSWDRLIPLRTRDDTRRFLRGILQNFVDTVDIEKSGLLDELTAVGVINERDAESLAGRHHPTRNEKARQLWRILFNIDHSVFVKKVLPILCQHFWYIIPQSFWLPGDAPPDQWCGEAENSGGSPRCTRCAIRRRIRPTDLGDLLMRAGLITSTGHGNISSYRSSTTDWSKIFQAFKKLEGHDISSHVTSMRKLMARYSLVAPDNLPQLLKQGFPCNCPSGKKSGLCLPALACLSPSSSNESGLPSIHSLSASGDNEGFDYPSTLSLQSASSQSEESSSGSHQLSDYHETTLKEVISISAQNCSSSSSEIDGKVSPSSDEVSAAHTERIREKRGEAEVKEREQDDTHESVVNSEGQPTKQSDPDDEEPLMKHVLEESVYSEIDETRPKALALRNQGSNDPSLATTHTADQRLTSETQITVPGNVGIVQNIYRRPSVSNDEFQLLPIPAAQPRSPAPAQKNVTSKPSLQTEVTPKLSQKPYEQIPPTGEGGDLNNFRTQTEVITASKKSWSETRVFDSRNVSCETLIHSSTLSVPNSTLATHCMRVHRNRKKSARYYNKWDLYGAQYSAGVKPCFCLGIGILGILLLALVLSPLALIAVGMKSENYYFAIAGCIVHIVLVVGFFIVTKK